MAKPIEKRVTSPIIVADFETGGTDPSINPITEFAAVAIDGETFLEIARCSVMFKPNFHPELTVYDEKALEVTHISMEMLETEGVPFLEAFNQIIDFFKKANINGSGIASKNRATLAKGGKKTQSTKNQAVLSGHNILFDHGFFQQLFFVASELGSAETYDDYFAGQYDLYGHFIPEMIDTFPLAKTYFSDKQTLNHKLGTFAAEFEVELMGAHRAINDVLGSTDIYRILANKIRSKGGSETSAVRIRNDFKF